MILAYVLGAQKNHIIDTVLLSTHNICFVREIRKKFCTKGQSLCMFLIQKCKAVLKDKKS